MKEIFTILIFLSLCAPLAQSQYLEKTSLTSASLFDGLKRPKNAGMSALYGAGVGISAGLAYDAGWLLYRECLKTELHNLKLDHSRFKVKSSFYHSELKRNPQDSVIAGQAEHAQERKLYFRKSIRMQERRLSLHGVGYINPLWISAKGSAHFAAVTGIVHLTQDWTNASPLLSGALAGTAVNTLWQGLVYKISGLGLGQRIPFSRFNLAVAGAGGALAGYLSQSNK